MPEVKPTKPTPPTSTNAMIAWDAKAEEIRKHLSQHTGDLEGRTRHPIGGMIFTTGVRDMAEKCGAFWLIDLIASHQPKAERLLGRPGIQFWWLIVRPKRALVDGGELVNGGAFAGMCYDTEDDKPVKDATGAKGWIITQEIEYCDFPMPLIQIWVSEGTAYLPSEH